MTKYIIRRVIQAIPVLIGITIVVYIDPPARAGRPPGEVRPEPADDARPRSAEFMKAWGLDQPIPIQYCRWMGFCDPDGEGFDFIGPTGWPNFLPTGISGSDERHPPRRPRLLDLLRREGQRPDHPGGPADVHPGRRRARHLDRHSRS